MLNYDTISTELARTYSKMIDESILRKLRKAPIKLIRMGERDLATRLEVELDLIERRKVRSVHRLKQTLDDNGYELEIKFPKVKYDQDNDNSITALLETESLKVIFKKKVLEL